MNGKSKKILLIDLDDRRRDSRIKLLEHAGYVVDLRLDYIEAEELDHEHKFDLVLIAVRELPKETIRYSDDLAKKNPDLPILLLSDHGVFIPAKTLSRHMESEYPAHLLQTIASMLAGSIHIREIEP